MKGVGDLMENQDDKRDLEMHQAKKGNQYYFGTKAHIGADEESVLVYSVVVTAADSGYTCAEKCPGYQFIRSG
ncbi:ISPsy2, transposase truncated [Pseudomonas sp. BAY1663]|nr:ISPsy2, transposase truncated [Pseudomonas sp. BAY1663]